MRKLDYHMKLHYSQTCLRNSIFHGLLDYHMKLHYSQTNFQGGFAVIKLDYHMKLHYSQTSIFEFAPLHALNFTGILAYLT